MSTVEDLSKYTGNLETTLNTLAGKNPGAADKAAMVNDFNKSQALQLALHATDQYTHAVTNSPSGPGGSRTSNSSNNGS